MNFELTDERQMLQDSLRRFLADNYPPQSRDSIVQSDAGYSIDIWNGLADLGVIGALFDEVDGGFADSGAGFDLALIFEELGRVGAVDPLLDTAVVGGGLIASAGNECQKKQLEDIIAGTCQLAFAHTEQGSRYDGARVATSAVRVPQGDQYELKGGKAVVVNAPAANSIIISARTSGSVGDRDGISLFCVPKGVQGVSLREYPLVGGGQAAELYLDKAVLDSSALLGVEGKAFEVIEKINARAVLAICAEALGLMEAMKSLTIQYLKTRNQFGRPIGKFQVLQHRMADVAIEMEQARSAVINLAGHVNGDVSAREIQVSATKNLVGNAAKLVTEESIQMHGGIAMTDEYELAHLARRLTMMDHRFGDTTYHLERFIQLAVA